MSTASKIPSSRSSDAACWVRALTCSSHLLFPSLEPPWVAPWGGSGPEGAALGKGAEQLLTDPPLHPLSLLGPDAERVCDSGAGEREVLEAEQATGAVLRPHQGTEITGGRGNLTDSSQAGRWRAQVLPSRCLPKEDASLGR